jgi:tetratricopeptide (TPR) repeat protein
VWGFTVLKTLLFIPVLLVLPLTAPVQAQQSLTAEQQVQEGNRYRSQKQYDKAVDSYKLAIEQNPSLFAAYYNLGTTYAAMGRMSDALAPIRTAVKLAPDNANAHDALGRVLEHSRQFDEALAELREATRLNPNNSSTLNEIGNLLDQVFGKPDEALAAYTEARRLDPTQPFIHHNIGLLLFRRGQYAEAIPSYEEALRLDPKYRNARYFLADCYTKTRQYDKAIDSWTKFLELVPNGPDALHSRAWTYLYMGGHGREAAADARTSLDVHGWQRPTAPYLAIIAHLGYREAGMSDEARAILDEAENKLKTEWPFGAIRYLKGELTADELLQSAGNNDKKTEAHAYIGMNLLLTDKSDEARTHFEWVKEYGNKRFFEYPLAMEELKRLK